MFSFLYVAWSWFDNIIVEWCRHGNKHYRLMWHTDCFIVHTLHVLVAYACELSCKRTFRMSILTSWCVSAATTTTTNTEWLGLNFMHWIWTQSHLVWCLSAGMGRNLLPIEFLTLTRSLSAATFLVSNRKRENLRSTNNIKQTNSERLLIWRISYDGIL